ncbi:MAG: hypothetical protein MUC99_08795 [Anaerolineae bacterium]|jgi:hypothetical protein|nr:hypothetical protein [Anaerolineae bacterium]
MRVLHAVTQQERFIASGTYQHHRDGALLSGQEQFSVHQQADGGLFIRIDDDWREVYHTSQLIEALTDPTGAVVFSRVVAQLQRGTTVKRETYDFYPDKVYIGLTGEGGARQDHEQALPLGYVPLFGKTSLLGWALAAWPDSGTAQAFRGYRDDLRHAPVRPVIRAQTDPRPSPYGEALGWVLSHDDDLQQAWVLPSQLVAFRHHHDLTIHLTNYAHRPDGQAGGRA